LEVYSEGDLAFHIKKMREKKQLFTEELILNWFLQIVFALGFVHSKKILHRDIKASNIFLTSLGYVKIGDFGISKILEGTMENADTVIGTPYYMRYLLTEQS
jgi:NIMA (never in mitosis gene a)-related kinase